MSLINRRAQGGKRFQAVFTTRARVEIIVVPSTRPAVPPGHLIGVLSAATEASKRRDVTDGRY